MQHPGIFPRLYCSFLGHDLGIALQIRVIRWAVVVDRRFVLGAEEIIDVMVVLISVVRLRKRQDGAVVAALMLRVEVGVRCEVPLNPVVAEHTHVRVAHDHLPQDVGAVIEVVMPHLGLVAAALRRLGVILRPGSLPEAELEAVSKGEAR